VDKNVLKPYAMRRETRPVILAIFGHVVRPERPCVFSHFLGSNHTGFVGDV